jgi:hypothetical protein
VISNAWAQVVLLSSWDYKHVLLYLASSYSVLDCAKGSLRGHADSTSEGASGWGIYGGQPPKGISAPSLRGSSRQSAGNCMQLQVTWRGSGHQTLSAAILKNRQKPQTARTTLVPASRLSIRRMLDWCLQRPCHMEKSVLKQ